MATDFEFDDVFDDSCKLYEHSYLNKPSTVKTYAQHYTQQKVAVASTYAIEKGTILLPQAYRGLILIFFCCSVAIVPVIVDLYQRAARYHRIRTQFEIGCVHMLIKNKIIKEKPVAKWQEIIHEIVDQKLDLKQATNEWLEFFNENYFSQMSFIDIPELFVSSHYHTISKFFETVKKYLKDDFMEIHECVMIMHGLYDIVEELDHFQDTRLAHSLKGYYSKYPFDAKITRTIMDFRDEMKEDIGTALKRWQNKQYEKAGESVGLFIVYYLKFEHDSKSFEVEELGRATVSRQDKDFASNMKNKKHVHPGESLKVEKIEYDPMTPWKKRALFRKF